MLFKIVRFFVALMILFTMLYLGRLCNALLPIGIPESIWGLLLLFSSLITGIIKIHWVMPATRPILRYMTLFFLPICASIIEHVDLIQSHLASLLVANFLSSILCLVLLGILAEWLFQQVEVDDE